MRGARPPGPHHGQPWLTFAFFIVELNTRRVVHLAVTRAPREQWTAQRLREATAFGQAPELLIRDLSMFLGCVEFWRAGSG
jgi:hypothetical protein